MLSSNERGKWCLHFVHGKIGPLRHVCVVCRVPAGTVDTVLSYCHYSLNDQTLADMIPYLKEKGVGIINASALSMGLLTDQAGPILQSPLLSLFNTFGSLMHHAGCDCVFIASMSDERN